MATGPRHRLLPQLVIPKPTNSARIAENFDVFDFDFDFDLSTGELAATDAVDTPVCATDRTPTRTARASSPWPS